MDVLRDLSRGTAVLKLTDVWFTRGSDVVLRDISLEIRRGEVVLVRGRSGVGKTTLAKIAALILQPSRGRVIFLDNDVSSMRSPDRDLLRLKHIGYIDQSYKLIPHITVLENVALPLRLLGYSKREAFRYARDALASLGIADLCDKYPEELSGGQKQRAAIARALAKKPTLIVADEPFSNLDEETTSNVLKALQEHIASSGGSVLITTTDLYTKYSCTREYVLRDGVLVEKQ